MYTVKKLFTGIHEMDNGTMFYGSGYAVMKNNKITSFRNGAEVFTIKSAATKEADTLNKADKSITKAELFELMSRGQ